MLFKNFLFLMGGQDICSHVWVPKTRIYDVKKDILLSLT